MTESKITKHATKLEEICSAVSQKVYYHASDVRLRNELDILLNDYAEEIIKRAISRRGIEL